MVSKNIQSIRHSKVLRTLSNPTDRQKEVIMVQIIPTNNITLALASAGLKLAKM